MICIDFDSYEKSVPKILDKLNAGKIFCEQKNILIKPNIVTKDPFPITTHPKMCKALIEYIKKYSNANIVVGDGCGSPDYSTMDAFNDLGYKSVSDDYNVELIDLNEVPLTKFENQNCMIYKELYLPEIINTHYIISMPVLKAHSFSIITGTMKNMMGFLPPAHYKGKFGIWNKAVFHNNVHESIIDLNNYVSPDLTVLDASVGLQDFHLGGPTCNPHVKKLVAGFEAKLVDRKAAELLGFDWKQIKHLRDEN